MVYTASDMVASIKQGSNTVTFDYGPDRSRIRRIDTVTNKPVTTTIYAGGKSVEFITSDTTLTEKTYRGDFAVISSSRASNVATDGPRQLRYLHRDHLGSVDVITREDGSVAQRMSFDAPKRSLAPPRRVSAAKPTGRASRPKRSKRSTRQTPRAASPTTK